MELRKPELESETEQIGERNKDKKERDKRNDNMSQGDPPVHHAEYAYDETLFSLSKNDYSPGIVLNKNN